MARRFLGASLRAAAVLAACPAGFRAAGIYFIRRQTHDDEAGRYGRPLPFTASAPDHKRGLPDVPITDAYLVGQHEGGEPLGAGIISDMQPPIGAAIAGSADRRAIHQAQRPHAHVAHHSGPICQDLGRQHSEPVRSAP